MPMKEVKITEIIIITVVVIIITGLLSFYIVRAAEMFSYIRSADPTLVTLLIQCLHE